MSLSYSRLASAVSALDRFSHDLVIVKDEQRGYVSVTP